MTSRRAVAPSSRSCAGVAVPPRRRSRRSQRSAPPRRRPLRHRDPARSRRLVRGSDPGRRPARSPREVRRGPRRAPSPPRPDRRRSKSSARASVRCGPPRKRSAAVATSSCGPSAQRRRRMPAGRLSARRETPRSVSGRDSDASRRCWLDGRPAASIANAFGSCSPTAGFGTWSSCARSWMSRFRCGSSPSDADR